VSLVKHGKEWLFDKNNGFLSDRDKVPDKGKVKAEIKKVEPVFAVLPLDTMELEGKMRLLNFVAGGIICEPECVHVYLCFFILN